MIKNRKKLQKSQWKGNGQQVKVRIRGNFQGLSVKIGDKCSE